MKLSATFAILTLLASGTQAAHTRGEKDNRQRNLSSKSGDLEGELSIIDWCKTEDGDSKEVKFSCEWDSDYDSKSRRLGEHLGDASTFPRELSRELKSASLKNVKCKAEWNGYSEKASLPFPDEWLRIKKEADDAFDAYLFRKSITIDVNGVIIGGGLEVELVVVEIDSGSGRRHRVLKSKEFLVYDDSKITVVCPLIAE